MSDSKVKAKFQKQQNTIGEKQAMCKEKQAMCKEKQAMCKEKQKEEVPKKNKKKEGIKLKKQRNLQVEAIKIEAQRYQKLADKNRKL